MVNQRFLSRLAWGASFFALGVIALGALTRLLDAGLGCPDWPGCYGHIIAPLTLSAKKMAALDYPNSQIVVYKAWAEMLHRYFVGGLSVLILTIILLIFIWRENRICSNVIIAIGLILLLIYQVLLGQWTVTLKLLPVIVSQHLLGGYLILLTLWMLHLNNTLPKTEKNNIVYPGLLFGAIIGLILLLLQIMLGAWTSTNYAALSCTDFPFCSNEQSMQWSIQKAFNLFSPVGVNYEGGVLPIVIRQTIQMAHRFGAVILTGYLVGFAAIGSLYLKSRLDLAKSLYVVLGLLCVQLCLGISNVIFKLPLFVATSHNLIAALLLLSVSTFIFKLVRQ